MTQEAHSFVITYFQPLAFVQYFQELSPMKTLLLHLYCQLDQLYSTTCTSIRSDVR